MTDLATLRTQLTVNKGEAARLLGIDRSTFYRLERIGALTACESALLPGRYSVERLIQVAAGTLAKDRRSGRAA